jgi:hypothetical protein
MSEFYQPGLVVSPNTLVRKVLSLPAGGKPIIQHGDIVRPETVVAHVNPRGYLHFVDVAREVELPLFMAGECFLKKEGDWVDKDEVIARRPSYFGMMARECTSPIAGVVERISLRIGKMTIRARPVPLRAGVHGRIALVDEERLVVVAAGALAQGVLGLGGPCHGILAFVDGLPGEPVTEDDIGPRHAGCVVVAGGRVTVGALRRAAEIGVVAFIAGSADKLDLDLFARVTLNLIALLAVDVPVTVMLTEGFGDLPMSPRTLGILLGLVGREASVDGTTQLRAGVVRPEVIVPLRVPDIEEAVAVAAVSQIVPAGGGVRDGRIRLGSRVRVVRTPHFGRYGEVIELPVDLLTLETEARVRAARLRLETGETVVVPRSNLERVVDDEGQGGGQGGG